MESKCSSIYIFIILTSLNDLSEQYPPRGKPLPILWRRSSPVCLPSPPWRRYPPSLPHYPFHYNHNHISQQLFQLQSSVVPVELNSCWSEICISVSATKRWQYFGCGTWDASSTVRWEKWITDDWLSNYQNDNSHIYAYIPCWLAELEAGKRIFCSRFARQIDASMR